MVCVTGTTHNFLNSVLSPDTFVSSDAGGQPRCTGRVAAGDQTPAAIDAPREPKITRA